MSSFFEQLQSDREVDVKFWKKHPELRSQLVDDAYPDEAHFIYELLQNAEDAEATNVTFELMQSKLVLSHDGKRLFSERDVEAITDVSKSAKDSSVETIGKFGIGFKSVFKYTDTPRIHSGSFSFEIVDFVFPQVVESTPKQASETVFVFPFNHPLKSATDAFAEVGAGLADMSATTLLFLSCVKTISWKIGNQHGTVFREEHSDNHIVVHKETENGRTASSHWLRFTAPVNGLRKHYVAIAYELAFSSDRSQFESEVALPKQFRIVPSAKGTVSVFFPAEKEVSGLRFHLHAPFLPELSRASVKNSPVNRPLFAQLAELAARSLHDLKRLGLLTGEFLAVLPSTEDNIHENYRVIREAVIREMREQPLTPTHRKGFTPARALLQAGRPLKDLLTDDDLAFLHERNDGLTWAIGATQRNSAQDKFLGSLGIEVWDVAEFAELISERASNYVYSWSEKQSAAFMKWLASKSDEWHQQLYALLHRALADRFEYYRVKSAKIIRLADGTYCVGSRAYFPDTMPDKADPFPRISAAILGGNKKSQLDDAREFLKNAGVKEVGESELIGLIIKARYAKGVPPPSDDVYLADLKKFIVHLEKNATDCQQFFGAYVFKLSSGKWGMPGHVYLDRPYKETGLRFYHEAVADNMRSRWALSDWYLRCGIDLKKITSFAQAVGCDDSFSEFVLQTTCGNNPQWSYLYSVAGSRYTSPINRDYTISTVTDSMLKAKSVDFSRLVWRTMCDLHVQKLRAVYQKNETGGAHTAPSLLVHLVKDAEWVPLKDGRFVKPCDASREGLLDGFTFDAAYEWLRLVGFGENERKKSVEYAERTKKREELGFKSDDELAKAQAFVRLPPEEQDRILQEHARRSVETSEEFPERPVRNKDLRRQRVREQALNTPKKETEIRSRAVSIGFDAIKAEAKQYLHDQYTNENDVMFCQICKAPLPFRLPSGNYYFEAVEVISGSNTRYREAFLALCPNHAAMFQHANDDRSKMRQLLETAADQELEINLAGQPIRVQFTETHLADIRACLEALNLEQADTQHAG